MTIPDRTRNKDGRFRKKRSDAGKPRGPYRKRKLEPEEHEESILLVKRARKSDQKAEDKEE